MEKYNGKRRYYFGIDLGTTNSVLAWMDIKTQRNGFIEPKVVEVSVPGKIATHLIPLAGEDWPHIVQEELLPSCVCFPYGRNDPIVGPHAKGELIRTPGIAAKSIKTKMGTDYSRDFQGTEYTAPKLSSKILTTLVDGVPTYVPKNELLNEVVIGVPASFDAKMKKDTEDAARIAGFKTPILFDEPIAALYDYRNQQEQGKFPPGAVGIEFSDVPKLILVFDLGGGTLDVSLHKVTSAGGNKLNIQNSLVSRYTAIGGDNFDNLIAAYFLDKTGKPYSLKPFVQEYTEHVKIALSHEATTRIRNGKNPNSAKTRINIPVLGASFQLTLSEYKEIASSLLAYNLTLEAVNSNNIIYPIIDVLKKWEEKFGSIPTPDAVLLNGSMTRFYTIQERLEHFFPDVPISNLGNPEIAVARGAVVEHYNMHNP